MLVLRFGYEKDCDSCNLYNWYLMIREEVK